MDDEKGMYCSKPVHSCPSWTTFIVYSSIVIVTGSVLIPLEFNYGLLNLYMRLGEKLPAELSIKDYFLHKLGYINTEELHKEVIMSKEELKKYSGEADKIYLAILGKVFDVTKGRKHYGKDGGYSFFAGIDGSCAFVTGEFNGKGLTDNIEGLKPQDYVGLMDWMQMYYKDYIYIGKVDGYFYDSAGTQREGFRVFQAGYEAGKKEKASDENDNILFPGCNSHWTADTGTEISCGQASGGVRRDWIGYPRMFFKPGKTSHRCACIKREHFSDPRFKEYANCPPTARKCKIKGT
ncbi:neuferricin-like [Hydractinia symbiolongicarpus]|uniref:neuferricin-like n=1 Tax=Hydractinia symbiolongicarpus TaxID=13093 RepID=UPI00254E9D98|nr:neuferricin-like [Hydractinia symbiolongicarpus]